MSINRFEKILQFFHGNDSVKHHPVIHKDHDKLYNVRPVIYSLVYLVLSLSLLIILATYLISYLN